MRDQGHESSAIGVKFLWRGSYGEDTVKSELVDGNECVMAGGARVREGWEDDRGEMSSEEC